MLFLGPTYRCELRFIISCVWKVRESKRVSRYNVWFSQLLTAYIGTIAELCHDSEEMSRLKEGVTVPLKLDELEFFRCFGTVLPCIACCVLHPLCCNLHPQFQYRYGESQGHCVLLYIFYSAGKHRSVFQEMVISLIFSCCFPCGSCHKLTRWFVLCSSVSS